ncbi:MAG: hypothetical protein V1774_06610 [Candidatus Eisenbacteria bacterium]
MSMHRHLFRQAGARAAVLCLGGLAVAAAAGPGAERVGGCATQVREGGLPAIEDSLAQAAMNELLAPKPGHDGTPSCRRLGVNAALFLQIGAVDSLADSLWQGISGQVTDRLRSGTLILAQRSALLRTTGPCFPPFHVDFRACGDSTRVRGFIDSLVVMNWDEWTAAPERKARDLFISAGMSLQQMDTVVDLRHEESAR